MSFTNVWDETTPAGSAAANTLDTIIQGLKKDIRERVDSVFGTSGASSFGSASLVNYKAVSINLNGSATSKIIPGSTSLSHRDSTDSFDNLLINENGSVTIRNIVNIVSGGLTVSAGGINVTGSSQFLSGLVVANGLTISSGGLGLTGQGVITQGGTNLGLRVKQGATEQFVGIEVVDSTSTLIANLAADTTNSVLKHNVKTGYEHSFQINSVDLIHINTTSIKPVTTNAIDLGTSALKFKDLWLSGTLNVGITNLNNATLSGTLDISGNARNVEHANGDLGVTPTIDFSTGNNQSGNLNINSTVTFTFQNLRAGSYYRVRLTNTTGAAFNQPFQFTGVSVRQSYRIIDANSAYHQFNSTYPGFGAQNIFANAYIIMTLFYDGTNITIVDITLHA